MGRPWQSRACALKELLPREGPMMAQGKGVRRKEQQRNCYGLTEKELGVQE